MIKKIKNIKKLLAFFLYFCLIALFALSIVGFQFYSFIHSPVTVEPTGYVIEIPTGTPVQKIAKQLKAANVINTQYGFMLWVYLHGAWNKLQAGEYLIKFGSTPTDVIDQIRDGKVIQHAITIVPGWTFERLMQEVNAAPKLNHTLAGLNSLDIMAKINHASEHPEGRFFPETYYFPAGTTDVAFLQRAYNNLASKLNVLWNEKTRQNGPLKSAYEALILASIVEKESGFSDEYGEIAGVFIRRLERNMPLQADPTVIYGAGKSYSGTITVDHLKTDTPYNTYQNKGLPPTPIALPSLKALTAVLNPKPGESLYFVARPDGKGHVFSDTLEAHSVAVAEYRKSRAGAK